MQIANNRRRCSDTMAALNKTTAPRVKARVMSGVNKGGKKLSFEELQPDIQRLLDYANTMQGPNQRAYRAKLTSELNVRIHELERERMDAALGNVSQASSSQGVRIDVMKQQFQEATDLMQNVQESMGEVSSGHQDLHESVDAAVDQHQTSNTSNDDMANLMGTQCHAAAVESKMHDDQSMDTLEDSLVLMDENKNWKRVANMPRRS